MKSDEIRINILKRHHLSFGDVYTIEFPKSVVPSTGLRFTMNSDMWVLVAITHKSDTEVFTDKKSIWDCQLQSMNGMQVLSEGEYVIKVNSNNH